MDPNQPTPIIIVGSSQRCGTTMIQRFLSSHPQVRIWGEHEGVLTQLFELGAFLVRCNARAGHRGRQELAEAGHDGFLANLFPENSAIETAVRSFILNLFARPAEAEGRPIWGFKEVRYGLGECVALRHLFPLTRVIHIIRDPRAVLCSFDYWERTDSGWDRADTIRAVSQWAKTSGSLAPIQLEDNAFIMQLRYEDVIANPAAAGARIEEHLAFDAETFDRRVWEKRVHTHGPDRDKPRVLRGWSELPEELRALLDSEDVRRAARLYAYDLDTDSH